MMGMEVVSHVWCYDGTFKRKTCLTQVFLFKGLLGYREMP